MTQRTYTLEEIDRMRRAVFMMHTPRLTNGAVYPGGYIDKMYDNAIRNSEEQLRTYMAGGVSPEELEARAKEYER